MTYTTGDLIYDMFVDTIRIKSMYRVRQKNNPLRFFAVFSAISWNFKTKFYGHI